MKKKAKRIVSAICALAMCAAMVPAAAFAEDSTVPETTVTLAADGGAYDADDDINVITGSEITLQGDATGTEHKWSVSANGGYDVSGIQITSDTSDSTITVKVTKPGVYTVRHSWNTGLAWPMATDFEIFTIEVSAEKLTAGDLEIYVETAGLPEGQPATLNFTLHYRSTTGPGGSGNFDGVFTPIAFTGTFSEESGTRVRLAPAEGSADRELLTGYYRLDYEKTGTSQVWNEDEIRKEESIYFEVTEDKMVRFCSSGGNIISDYESFSTVAMRPASNVYTLTFNTDGGNAILPALYAAGMEATLPTAIREGYAFAGWDTNGDGQADVQANGAYTVSADATLKAIWTESDTPETDPDTPEVDPVPPETDPVTPNPDEEDGVTVDKTATDLVDDKSNVTLTVGGGEETTASDVVFVLDKSASSDIRQEAMNMLTELQAQAGEGNIINVGVVNFEKGVLEQLELTALNDENYDTIEDAMIFHDVASSGTNIYAGLVAGEAMLDADTTVDDADKHLVLVTDGVGYLWGDGNGNNVFSIYSESISNGEENLYASHETIDWHHDSATYYDEFQDMLKWYNTHSNSIAADMDRYQVTYEEGQYKAKDYGVTSNQGENTDWSVIPKFKTENSYVPYELESTTASAPDAAIYMVAREWIKIAGKYNAYAYADPRYEKNGKYLWAYNAISNLGDLGDASYALPENVADYKGMFDAVKSTVLYDIEKGTVTDVIGSNFDVASLDSFVLTVGGTEMKGTVNGNTVTFDNGNYVVTYQPGENEQFTWAINVPVKDGAAVQLTYTVKLVNKATAPGDYTVPTNEEAKLDYTSTTGGQGTEEFPVPEVSYNVPETTTVTVTGTPTPDEHPDIAEGIANGTWGAAPTATPAATSTIPQTSDSLPLGALIVVAIVAAGAVCGLVVLRKRNEQ